MNDSNNVVAQIENLQWYQSSVGPKISMTVKALAALVVPLLISTGILKSGLPWLDSIIDVGCILGTLVYALIGYVRSKQAMATAVGSLRKQVTELGAVPRA